MKRILKWIGIIVIIAVIVALVVMAFRTFGGDGNSLEVGTPVLLECNKECADRGLCGTRLADGQKVVLGSSSGPSVISSTLDIYFSNDLMTTIAEKRLAKVRQADGAEGDMEFFRLDGRNAAQDLVKSGWVVGWCVKPP